MQCNALGGDIPSLSPTTSPFTSPVLEMALSSNVIINGSTINSVQGDFHIHNKDSESGMHNFKSIKKNLLIDDPTKDLIPY